MKVRDFNKIITKLQQNFIVRAENNDHLNFDICDNNGKLVLWLKRSHSLKDEHDKLIAKNLHISLSELREFIRCNLSADSYQQILERKNII